MHSYIVSLHMCTYIITFTSTTYINIYRGTLIHICLIQKATLYRVYACRSHLHLANFKVFWRVNQTAIYGKGVPIYDCCSNYCIIFVILLNSHTHTHSCRLRGGYNLPAVVGNVSTTLQLWIGGRRFGVVLMSSVDRQSCQVVQGIPNKFHLPQLHHNSNRRRGRGSLRREPHSRGHWIVSASYS